MNYNPFENTPNTESSDNQNQPSNYNPYGNTPYTYRPSKPVNSFETAALVLGVIAALSFISFYGAIVCGAAAVIMASISRGKKMEYGSRAKIGMILGIASIILAVLLYAFAFYILLQEYGSIEGILREACDMMGYDFEELYGDLFQ